MPSQSKISHEHDYLEFCELDARLACMAIGELQCSSAYREVAEVLEMLLERLEQPIQ